MRAHITRIAQRQREGEAADSTREADPGHVAYGVELPGVDVRSVPPMQQALWYPTPRGMVLLSLLLGIGIGLGISIVGGFLWAIITMVTSYAS